MIHIVIFCWKFIKALGIFQLELSCSLEQSFESNLESRAIHLIVVELTHNRLKT